MTTKEINNESLLEYVKELICEGHTVTLKIKGYSMRPFLEHCRDYAILHPINNIKKGDVVLACIAKGHYVLHRIIRIEGNNITLMGDGNLKGTEHCQFDNLIAIAKSFIVKGNEISTDSRKWHIYSLLWPKQYLARRILLAFARRLFLRSEGTTQNQTTDI